MSAGESLWLLLFISWNLVLAYGDLRYRRVPNALVLCGLCGELLWVGAAFVATEWRLPPLWPGWMPALGGFLLALPFFLLWQRRIMGAGDVKVIAVLGFVLGPLRLLAVLAIASLIGGLHALLYLAVSRWWTPPGQFRRVPYAGYMALGAISVAFIPLSSGWYS